MTCDENIDTLQDILEKYNIYEFSKQGLKQMLLIIIQFLFFKFLQKNYGLLLRTDSTTISSKTIYFYSSQFIF